MDNAYGVKPPTSRHIHFDHFFPNITGKVIEKIHFLGSKTPIEELEHKNRAATMYSNEAVIDNSEESPQLKLKVESLTNFL